MKSLIKSLKKAWHKNRIISNYFYVVNFKWIKLDWIDADKTLVWCVECERKDAKWQLMIKEPRFNWMKWLGFNNITKYSQIKATLE